MIKTLLILILALCSGFVPAVRAAALAVPLNPAGETDPQKLTAILKSDAAPKEKAITCKRLAVYGTKDAVPALAPLLADEHLSSWARIALENIPDPACDDALRDAVGKLQGRLLIGVINSIGIRRDAKAIPTLTAKLKDADADVAAAAAVALGKIGGPTVAATLTSLLAPGRLAVAEGCIRCAEQLPAADAAKLYDAVRAANVSKQKSLEATRGAILSRGNAGIALLAEQLKSEDRAFFNIALRTAREIPGPAVVKVLLAEMEKAAADRQPALLLTLADRGDTETSSAAMNAAKSGSVELRITAINILERLGNAACAPVLLGIVAADDAAAAQAAKSALIRLPGAEVDAAVVAMLKQPQSRRAGIELVGARRITGAIPELLRAAEDAELGSASLKVLGDLAGEAELPALIGLLTKVKNTAAVESTLATICARSAKPTTGSVVIRKAVYGALPDGPSADVTAKVAGMVKGGATAIEASNHSFGDPANGLVKKLRVEYTVNGQPFSRTVPEKDKIVFAAVAVPPAFADALCAAMPQASGEGKLALLRILRTAGGPKALAAVRAATTDANAEIKETALRTLCDWPSVDALPDVTQLAKTATEKKWQILALRGQLRLIPQQETDAAQKLAALKDLTPLVERTEEKRLLLAALGDIPTAESLALITPYLSAPGLKEEAAIAAVEIAEKIAGKHPAEVNAAMKQVDTKDKKLANRARQLLQQSRKK